MWWAARSRRALGRGFHPQNRPLGLPTKPPSDPQVCPQTERRRSGIRALRPERNQGPTFDRSASPGRAGGTRVPPPPRRSAGSASRGWGNWTAGHPQAAILAQARFSRTVAREISSGVVLVTRLRQSEGRNPAHMGTSRAGSTREPSWQHGALKRAREGGIMAFRATGTCTSPWGRLMMDEKSRHWLGAP